MSEETKLEIKLRNLTYIVIIGFIVLSLLIIGLYFKGTGSTTSTGGSTTSDSTTEYDVSKMNEVTGEEATALFDKKGTHILYIGRSTCGVCVTLVPELNKTMDELDITVNYLPLGQNFRSDFGDLFDHLTIETTINGEEGTYGELLEAHGFTPLVIIIKDGKMVDGFVGSRASSTITELFKKYI